MREEIHLSVRKYVQQKHFDNRGEGLAEDGNVDFTIVVKTWFFLYQSCAYLSCRTSINDFI